MGNQNTDLPELPEGHYWSISYPWTEDNRSWFRLRIYRKLPWWCKVMTFWTDEPVAKLDMPAPLSDGLVRRTAEELLAEWEKSRIRDSDWAYVGEYPPKKLGQGGR